MKKVFLFMFILLMAVFMLAGCGSESGGMTGDESEIGENEKEFCYEIKNTSGKEWTLIGDFDTDFVYTGDNYGLDVAFAIKASENRLENFSVERLIKSGKLEETSNTTYKIVIRFIAGEIPNETGKDMVRTDLIMQDIAIKGTYNKYAVIEWDGTSFKQVK